MAYAVLAKAAAMIRANSILPARRTPIELVTADGLRLVGELAQPVSRPATTTLICVHPLPTQGGMMDSHLFRKAAWRLPALADIAVLRFNTRGTTSDAGSSEGSFADGKSEGLDVAAAIDFAVAAGLPVPWLLGWSFGTEVILKHAELAPITGVILLSPPLHRVSPADLRAWQDRSEPMLALIPEFDDYLPPDRAQRQFQPLSRLRLIEVADAKHLWVGEPYVHRVFNEIVTAVAPTKLDPVTGSLPTEWSGPMERASAGY